MYAVFFQKFTTWAVSNYDGIKSAIWSACKLFMKLSSFIVALGALVIKFVDISAGLDSMTEVLESATAVAEGWPVVEVMDNLNVVLPLNEFFILAGVLIALQILAVIVRLTIRVLTLGLG